MKKSSFETILQGGEAEWVENAPDTYSHDALDVWHTDIVPRMMSAIVKEIDVEDLRLFCPKMLEQLQDIFMHDQIDDIRNAIRKVLDDNA